MDKQTGTVKWFSREKGWGFIRLESGDEIFVHHSDIEGEGFVSLEDDEPVEFAVEEMDKGPRARHVRSLRDGGATSSESSGVTTASSTSTSSSTEARNSREDRRAERSERRAGGLRPLAEQLRERLGRRFSGLGD